MELPLLRQDLSWRSCPPRQPDPYKSFPTNWGQKICQLVTECWHGPLWPAMVWYGHAHLWDDGQIHQWDLRRMPLSTDTQYCFDYITYLQKCIDVKYTFIHIDVTVALSFTFSRQYYYLHYVTIVNTVSFQCEHNMNICLLWLSKWVGLRCSHFLWVEVDGLPLSSCMKDHIMPTRVLCP